MKTHTCDSGKTKRMRKKISRCATHKAILPDIIEACSVCQTLFYETNLKSNFSFRMFIHKLLWKHTQQSKNSSPKPDPQNAQLQSYKPVSIKHLTLANAITWHWRWLWHGQPPCWFRPTGKPGEFKTVADVACTEPHNLKHKAHPHSHSSSMWVHSLLRNLQEEPLEVVELCIFQDPCWKFLSVISYYSAPLLIITSANWPLCLRILNKCLWGFWLLYFFPVVAVRKKIQTWTSLLKKQIPLTWARTKVTETQTTILICVSFVFLSARTMHMLFCFTSFSKPQSCNSFFSFLQKDKIKMIWLNNFT